MQEHLVSITLEEFFLVEFFEKVTINMTLCYELDNKEEKQEKPPKDDDKTLTILETLPICMHWRQIFNLPKEIRQYVVVALYHPKLYVDKIKDVGQ